MRKSRFHTLSIRFTLSLLLLLLGQQAVAQRFFNLTYDQVRVDSLMPHFGYSIPLQGHWQDSLYTVSIVYPDFVEMTPRDIAAYRRLSDERPPSLPVVTQRIALDRKRPALHVGFCPLVFREGKYRMLVSFMLKVEAKALKRSQRKAAATRATAASERYAAHSVLSAGRWAKIRVSASGVYELTEALARRAGFSDLSRVKVYGYGGNLQNETLLEADLKAYDDLHEVPTCTVGGRRLFYARGPVSWPSATATQRIRNPYSDYGYYFLTQDDAPPQTLDETAFLASFYPAADDYHTLHEVDDFAWYQGGRNLFEDAPIAAGSSKTYTLAAPVAEAAGMVSITLSAGSSSTARVMMDGRVIGSMDIRLGSYDKGSSQTLVQSVTRFLSVNEIQVEVTGGGPVRVDHIALTCNEPRPAPNLWTDAFPVPEYVYNITPQDLHAHTAADMVIIIPTSQKLLAQAQRLQTFHEQRDGLRVRIVPADEIYNEFSSGTPDANAYRRYLKMLYDRAESSADMPRYLLLFGDCAWDNRMRTADWRAASVDDYLLCYESENSFNEVECYVDDGFFALLDDGEGSNPQEIDQLDLAVGRFPVVSESAAKTLVDKTIAYATNRTAGAWQNTLVFMGDDGNNNLHMRDVNEVAEDVAAKHPGYLVKKVMWDTYKRESSSTGYSYPEVTAVVKQYQQSGALVMDYAGHGRTDQISHESVLRLNDFKSFSNKNLPLWITASCDIMPFDGSVPTIGEAAILNPHGGAVAFFGTTRTVYAYYNKLINRAYLRYVLSDVGGRPVSIGEAQRLAKNLMITSGQDRTTNKLQYSLLGDPALVLNRPTARVVVDSINDLDVASHQPSLKAGSIVTVKGHVEGHPTFEGVVTATVRDKKEDITCRLNNTSKEGAETPFQYTDRLNTLYHGADSVRGGKFSFVFAVPRDIRYDSGTGLMNLYAVDNAHTVKAHGACDRFTVGGASMTHNDSIGPSIYCYLNSPAFVDGGNVNSQPLFVAKISDKDGLNTTGSGVGHDLQLIVDGQMATTYNLNDYFAYDFGSYTSGSVFFSLPELSEGPHTITFRAWDVQNNSSSASLRFYVVRGMLTGEVDINATENPTRTTTTFIVSHDMGATPMDVEIEVFDSSGRQLWTSSETGVSALGSYTKSWDLTTADGSRLQTGIYLYRVKFAAKGGTKTSKVRKLIVLNNK